MFAVPWYGKTILGTTDTPRKDLAREPEAFAEDVGFILREAGALPGPGAAAQPTCARSGSGCGRWSSRWATTPATPRRCRANTRSSSAASGLVTVTGGKWTTYRSMAEDVLAQAMDARPAAAAAGWRDGAPAAARRAPGRPCASRRVNTCTAAKRPCCAACRAPTNWLWRDAGTGPAA
jgi:glycerol-3-phosphate dehydrogenase